MTQALEGQLGPHAPVPEVAATLLRSPCASACLCPRSSPPVSPAPAPGCPRHQSPAPRSRRPHHPESSGFSHNSSTGARSTRASPESGGRWFPASASREVRMCSWQDLLRTGRAGLTFTLQVRPSSAERNGTDKPVGGNQKTIPAPGRASAFI